MDGFTETVGVTVYQSVLTAIGSFRFLRWMASLYQSVLTEFSVPEMGGFTETVGVNVYQSVLTAVGSFRFLRWLALYQSVLTAVGSFLFLRWVASLRQLASLPIKVS